MKKLLTIIAIIFFTTTTFAQTNLQDVIYLKNGSIIRGTIIEQIPNISIKIETSDRNVFVYKMNEIEKFTKEQATDKKVINRNNSGNSGLKRGYKGILEAGYQIGVGIYGMDRIKLHYINGFQVNPNFSIGLGTGVNLYPDGAGSLVVPIYGDFRVNFLDNHISPYVSLGAGYSFDATNSFTGVGLLISPNAGVTFKVGNKTAMNFGVGYEMQKMDFLYQVGNYSSFYAESHNSGAFSINLGISF